MTKLQIRYQDSHGKIVTKTFEGIDCFEHAIGWMLTIAKHEDQRK